MKILLIYLLLVVQVFANEKQNCFEWEGSSDTISKDGKPYSTLWIYYCSDNNKIEGSYSFITLYGNRIDGEYNKNSKILNGIIKDDTISIKFYNWNDPESVNSFLVSQHLHIIFIYHTFSSATIILKYKNKSI